MWVSVAKALLLVEGDLRTDKKNPKQKNKKQLTQKKTQGLCFLAPQCVKVCCVFPSKAQVTTAKCFREETGQ